MVVRGLTDPAGAGAAPKLSVVMPVHNALPHLDGAIESILNQTHGDFEFVILDDASSDGSGERLREWAERDSRIRLLRSDRNLGPVGSSNAVANAAKAPFVARMDADDISHPDRLRQQLQVFHDNPNIGVVGSLCDIIDASGAVIRTPEAWRMRRRSPFVPFAHGAMMYRRSVFERVGGYRQECAYWEDQDLVVRMAAVSRVLVLPHALYQIRAWTNSTRVASDPEEIELALHRMYSATDQLRLRGDYEAAGNGGGELAKVDPRVFIAMGSVRLWAGEKPRLFTRLLQRGDLSLNAKSVSALVWAAWASASPGSLRAFLKLLLGLRNRLGTTPEANGGAVAWDPFSEDARLEERPATPARPPSAA